MERFEDLSAWQKARELTREVYRISRKGTFARDFGLSGQIQRARVSDVQCRRRLRTRWAGRVPQFVIVAKASCAEVRSHLYAALDAGHLEQAEFQLLLARAEELARILGGLRAALECQRKTQD